MVNQFTAKAIGCGENINTVLENIEMFSDQELSKKNSSNEEEYQDFDVQTELETEYDQ